VIPAVSSNAALDVGEKDRGYGNYNELIRSHYTKRELLGELIKLSHNLFVTNTNT